MQLNMTERRVKRRVPAMKASHLSHPQFGQRPADIDVRLKLVLFAASIGGALIVATQTFAWRAHFDPALGSHWRHVLSAPWRMVQWQMQWGAVPQERTVGRLGGRGS